MPLSLRLSPKRAALFFTFLILQGTAGLYAGEGIFGFTLTTDTVPKNKAQLQQWYAGKYGKLNGIYVNNLWRTQAEYGVTDAYQTGIYLNVRDVHARKSSPRRTTGGEDVDEGASPDKTFNNFLLEGVSIENLYRLTSPVTAPLGTAAAFEASLGRLKYELKPRLILQKNFMEDQLTWAVNTAWALQWKKKREKKQWVRESDLELSSGVSYRFRRNWSAGAEFLMRSGFSSFSPGNIEYSAFFLGPNLHYASRRFWATLALFLQIPPGLTYTERAEDALQGRRIFGNEEAAVELRLKAGYALG